MSRNHLARKRITHPSHPNQNWPPPQANKLRITPDKRKQNMQNWATSEEWGGEGNKSK